MVSCHRGLISLFLVLSAILTLVACAGQSAVPQGAGSKAMATAVEPVKGPRLALEEESFDFGKVPLDKTVAHKFRLKNVGSEPLVLNGAPQVRAAQGC